MGLNKKEQEEKEKLITRGFGNWTKKDFTAFTKACEYYGRNEYDDIARDVGTKTPQEVKQYSKVFWKKIKDLAGMWCWHTKESYWAYNFSLDSKKIISNIEKGEKRIARVEAMISALEEKVASCSDPRNDLEIVYTYSKKAPAYQPEEDRFLVSLVLFFDTHANEVP